jgi:hypothetical protein
MLQHSRTVQVTPHIACAQRTRGEYDKLCFASVFCGVVQCMHDFQAVQVTEFDSYAVANIVTYAPRRVANFSATLCPRERMEEAPSRRIGTDRRGGIALDITDKHRS